MRAKSQAWAGASLFLAGVITCTGVAQEGVGQRLEQGVQGLGRGIKRGAQDIGGAVRKGFDNVRSDVHRMGTHSRVYSRLHWDRSLHRSNIEVHMLRDGSVLLAGTVPDQKAKEHAVEMTRNTMGVTSVIDELTPLGSDDKPKMAGTGSDARPKATSTGSDDKPKTIAIESPEF